MTPTKSIRKRMKEMQDTTDGCTAASIAYILGLPRECVPNFIKHSENEDMFWQVVESFLFAWGFQLVSTKSKKGLTLVIGQCGDIPHIIVERDGEEVFNTDDPLSEEWGRWRIVPVND